MQLADAVTEALERKGWSLRAAQIYSGVNFSTIDRMKRGFVVETEAIVQFAQAVADKGQEVESALYFLRLAGKDNILSLVEAAKRLARDVPDDQTQEIELRPGHRVRVVATDTGPGTTFEATPENLTFLESGIIALEKAKNQ